MSIITKGLGSEGLVTKGFGWLRLIIEKIIGKIKEILRPKYYDARFKISVEKLSIAKTQSKAMDISQLSFDELMSLDELRKFYKPKEK